MAEFLIANMAPIMFASMIVFLLVGFPVAFALAANGVVFGLIGIKLGLLGPQLFQATPDRIYSIMANETLLAVPFFTFMGLILERSGMAEDLLDTIGQVFGPIRGGLAYAVIFVGALLAATTGIVAASVISMGLISLPIMLRYGYDKRLASGVIAASGTLAQIIPPSLVLIVMADQVGQTVANMYKGALAPALVLTSLYIGYVAIVSVLRPRWVPALPVHARFQQELNGRSGLISLGVVLAAAAAATLAFSSSSAPLSVMSWLRREEVAVLQFDEKFVIYLSFATLIAFALALADSWIERVFGKRMLSVIARTVTFVLIPPLLLIFLVLGTISIGIATSTEGGAMGATGALIMALARRRLSLELLKQAMESTVRLTTFVLFILIGARVFSLTFYGVDGDLWVEHLLVGLPGGQLGFLIVVNLLIFFLAFFLDYFELAFIVVPLLAPVAAKLGIDLVWFGVLLAINMQTSFLHPPFGFALFFLRSVAPSSVKSSDIYWGAVPFVLIQIVMVALVIAFPQIVTFNLDHDSAVNVDSIKIEIPAYDYDTDDPLAPTQ